MSIPEKHTYTLAEENALLRSALRAAHLFQHRAKCICAGCSDVRVLLAREPAADANALDKDLLDFIQEQGNVGIHCWADDQWAAEAFHDDGLIKGTGNSVRAALQDLDKMLDFVSQVTHG